jgi:hypothetical protein
MEQKINLVDKLQKKISDVQKFLFLIFLNFYFFLIFLNFYFFIFLLFTLFKKKKLKIVEQRIFNGPTEFTNIFYNFL